MPAPNDRFPTAQGQRAGGGDYGTAEELDQALRRFPPKLSISGLTVTVALLWGGTVLFCGLANLLWPSYGVALLQLVSSIYPGYHATRSLGSVVVGTLHALLDGAVYGLVFGWLYNRVAGA